MHCGINWGQMLDRTDGVENVLLAHARKCLTVLLTVGTFITPCAAGTWTYLGVIDHEISAPRDVFIDWNDVEVFDEDQFLVTTLEVHPHTVKGIDLFDQNGGHIYDLGLPHRSIVSIDVYDCVRRMKANIRYTYYLSKWPKPDEVVFDQIDDDPMFFGQFFGYPSETLVLDAVCAPKDVQEFELLG